jgi:hypothetical protein
MKEGQRTDQLGLFEELGTAIDLNGFKVVKVGEMPISNPFIGERPEALGWLKLRRIGRKKNEMDALGNANILTDMPARLIKHKNDMLVRTSSHGTGKMLQSQGEDLLINGGQEQPFHLTRSWADEPVEVKAFKALMHHDARTSPLADPCSP